MFNKHPSKNQQTLGESMAAGKDALSTRGLTQTREGIMSRVIASPEYKRLVLAGNPRPGHPEGTVAHHIMELEANLAMVVSIREKIGVPLSSEQILDLKILIHTHDTFKGDSLRGVAIEHPKSHASLAAAFLRQIGADTSLCQIAQMHDIPYSMWRKRDRAGAARLLTHAKDLLDLPTFTIFQLVDNLTLGKNTAPVAWFVQQLSEHALIDPCNWQLLQELLKTQTDTYDCGERGKLSLFCSREVGPLLLQKAEKGDYAIIQKFIYHLRLFCEMSDDGRSAINGLSANYGFPLPNGWTDVMVDVLRNAPAKLSTLVCDERSHLSSDRGANKPALSKLFERSLESPEDGRAILHGLVDSVGNRISQDEQRALDKFFLGIYLTMQDFKLSKEMATCLLVAFGAALVKYADS